MYLCALFVRTCAIYAYLQILFTRLADNKEQQTWHLKPSQRLATAPIDQDWMGDSANYEPVVRDLDAIAFPHVFADAEHYPMQETLLTSNAD